jgi:hypothetical protein
MINAKLVVLCSANSAKTDNIPALRLNGEAAVIYCDPLTFLADVIDKIPSQHQNSLIIENN